MQMFKIVQKSLGLSVARKSVYKETTILNNFISSSLNLVNRRCLFLPSTTLSYLTFRLTSNPSPIASQSVSINWLNIHTRVLLNI